MAANYAIGVFVYRSYVNRLKASSIVCTLQKRDMHFVGSIKVESDKNLKLIPIDFQIYIYNEEGDLLQVIADSIAGNFKSFEVESKTDLPLKQLKVTGISNARIKWLWLEDIIPISIEVQKF